MVQAFLNNVVAYPGADFAGRTDAGQVHLKLDLSFATADEAKAWLVQNDLPTVIFNRK